MHKFIIITISILLLQNHIKACDCPNERGFLQASVDASLIAEVEVLNHFTFDKIEGRKELASISVKVINILKGKEQLQEIIIWSDSSSLCSSYMHFFKPGSKWIMALNPTQMKTYQPVNSEGYSLSKCGKNYLRVQGRITQGMITDDKTYQSMTVVTLKAHLDIINREGSKIDFKKERYLSQLQDLGVDTIGIFENYKVNDILRPLHLKTSPQMPMDAAFPKYYEYMQGATINRQLFIYWQFQGKTYVKQIDNIFDYDAIEVNDVAFFDIYLEHKPWLVKERLALPATPKKAKQINKRIKRHQRKNAIKQKVSYLTPSRNIINLPENYLLQSVQFFIDGTVFLRDFDTRLFDASYNPKNYKSNRKALTYEWLEILTEEAEELAKENETSQTMFRQFKRLYVLE